MVYLFEDRKIRKEKYLKGDIVSELFNEAEFDCNDDLFACISEKYGDAKVVIFHKSYDVGDLSMDDLEEAFERIGAVFVRFSGDFESSLSKPISANSEQMYKHLPGFVRDYEQTGQSKIELLIYGPNYLQNELKGLNYKVRMFLANKGIEVTKADINDLWELVDDTISVEELKPDKDVLLNWLVRLEEESNVKTELIKSQIQKFIKRHE